MYVCSICVNAARARLPVCMYGIDVGMLALLKNDHIYIHTYRQACICVGSNIQRSHGVGRRRAVRSPAARQASTIQRTNKQASEPDRRLWRQCDSLSGAFGTLPCKNTPYTTHYIHIHTRTLTLVIHTTYIHIHSHSCDTYSHSTKATGNIYNITLVMPAFNSEKQVQHRQYKQYTITYTALHCTVLFNICLLHSFINKHSVSLLLFACDLFHLPTTYDNQQLPDSSADAAADIVIDAVLLMLQSRAPYSRLLVVVIVAVVVVCCGTVTTIRTCQQQRFAINHHWYRRTHTERHVRTAYMDLYRYICVCVNNWISTTVEVDVLLDTAGVVNTSC